MSSSASFETNSGKRAGGGCAERNRGVYTSLGLRVTAYKDGTLELTCRAGKGR